MEGGDESWVLGLEVMRGDAGSEGKGMWGCDRK